jgi:RNA polymerase sigma-70 factor (ECF subfamily)
MTTNDKASDFVLEWNASSRQVYAFILSLLPNSADADEAFQETGKVLWEKFSEYQSGSSFTSWACRAAFISAMELRRRKRRSPLACGHSALIECMEKITTSDRDLLRRRYVDGGTVATVAAEVGRSIKVVYKELGRIHESLFRCIERTIRQEGA